MSEFEKKKKKQQQAPSSWVKGVKAAVSRQNIKGGNYSQLSVEGFSSNGNNPAVGDLTQLSAANAQLTHANADVKVEQDKSVANV